MDVLFGFRNWSMDRPSIEGKDCKSTFSKATILSPPTPDERNQHTHSGPQAIVSSHISTECAALWNVRIHGADTENDEETQR